MSAATLSRSRTRPSRTPGVTKVWLTPGLKQEGNPRTFQPVRRNSYHVGDREHQVWRKIGDGSKREGRRFAGILLKAAWRYDRDGKQPGKANGPLGNIALEVLREMFEMIDFMEGTLEPALLTLSTRLRRSKSAIVNALARLKAHGFITWIRRTEPVKDPDPFGPQVKQASNAYGFDINKLPEKVMRAVKAVFDKGAPPPSDTWAAEADPKQLIMDMLASHPLAEQASLWAPGTELSASLDSLGAALEAAEKRRASEATNASLPDGQKPGDISFPNVHE
jgi:hypothetical protein